MENSNSSLNYMPQLDALRAFAVILVLTEHWLPQSNLLHFINPGYIGVTFFFVLSGFLITRILIKNQQRIQVRGKGKGLAIKQFIIRRALRIFPVYYLTIFVFYLLNAGGLREKASWYILYAANFFMYKNQHWDGIFTHLWTLAVEEQFYLFWPFIILFTPQKHLLKVILMFIAIGPMFRFLVFWADSQAGFNNMAVILTPSCFDAFGLGALLAYSKSYVQDANPVKAQIKYAYSLSVIAYLLLVASFWPQFFRVTFYGFIIAAGSYFLIQKASEGFKAGILKSILEQKVLLYLGKISYGLYLFHNFIPYFHQIIARESVKYNWNDPLTAAFAVPGTPALLFKFLIYFIVLVLIATVSWYGFEKPINNLKRHFEKA